MQFWGAGFIAGICGVALSAQIPSPGFMWVLTIAGVVLLSRFGPKARLASGVCIAVVIAGCHGARLLENRIDERCEGMPVRLVGTIASLPQRQQLSSGSTRVRFAFVVDDVDESPCAGLSRVLLSWYGERPLAVAQRWRLTVKLKRPRGRANPAGFGVQAWFARSGVHAVGHVVEESNAQRLPSSPAGPLYQHHQLRQHVSRSIAEAGLGEQSTALLQAITVADARNISEDLWRGFRHLGISHLLVISGLHIGLVAGLVLAVARLAASRLLPGRISQEWFGPVGAVTVAGAYCVLAGLSLPTQRALIMLCCVLLLRGLGRQGGAGGALLVAACLILLVNPLAVIGSGFWLSFGAVLALVWLSGWLRGTGAARLLLTHLYMTLVMVPAGAWFFGGASLLAMVANLVFIPLVGFFLVPLALLGVFLCLSGLPGASLLWTLAAFALDHLVLPVITLAAAGAIPGYVNFSATAVPLVLALSALPLMVLPGWGYRKLLPMLLFLPLLTTPRVPLADIPDRVEVTVLDVGQGTAVVVRAGGRALLYDTGPGDPEGRNAAQDIVVPFLRSKGVLRLDTLIISHGDTDHSAGTRNVLAQLPAARFRYGAGMVANPSGRQCRAGESWHWGPDIRFRILSPGAMETRSNNNGSCVLLVDVGGYRLLLPGDIESRQERELVVRWQGDLRAHWLLVSHHGSATSSTHTLLKHVRAREAIVSAGFANPFGHPSRAVVERLQQHEAVLLDTANLGAMRFDIIDGQLARFSAWRQRPLPYWM